MSTRKKEIVATTVKQVRDLLWKEGAVIVYHVGNLLYDREQSDAVDLMGKAAWEAYLDKRALLFQQRVSPGVCRYIAHVL
jgi:hypothetical protein